MDLPLENNTVFITGASSGIGEACARQFAQAGCRLILAARRIDRLETLAQELQETYSTKILTQTMDVTNKNLVEKIFSQLDEPWRHIDILINNAGLASGLDSFQEADVDDWEKMINTNIKGLLYVTRAAINGMLERNKGHIMNIGSIAGHQTYPKGHVYCATKAAVKSITEGIKLDLTGSKVRVSSIDPGLVETEFSKVRFHNDEERAKLVYQGVTPLQAKDIADIVYFCASRPAHVNIKDIVVIPTDQSSATLVHRKN